MKKESEIDGLGRRRAVRLTLTFLVASLAWIIVTDLIVKWMLPDNVSHAIAQTLKGIFYVLTTTALVFWLSKRAFRHIAQSAIESQAHRTAEHLQTVMANLGEAVLIVDPSTSRILRCNAAVETVFGYSPEELTGKTTEILHQNSEQFEAFARIGEAELERHGIFRCEQPLKHKDGAIRQTEVTVVALQKELGWRGGVASIIRDVTAQKEAESALKRSESQYRLLAENTLDIIWSMTPDLVFTYVNPAIEMMTGYTPSEYVGTHLRQHFAKADLGNLEGVIDDEISKGPHAEGVVIDTNMLRKDGSPVAAEVHGKVIFDADGKPVAIQGTTRDITQRRALEAGLRQSQKLQAIGTFAGGVAHEINNPIMGISGYAEIIAAASDDRETQEYCSNIQEETNRILITGKRIEKSGEQWVRLSVEDRGTGIPVDVKKRMFDPFFTTKLEEEGTGLGMWIVYRIVNDHGGEISVETEPGEFTRLNVDLPAA